MNHCQVPALVKFTLLLFVLLLLVTACHRHADSADEQIRRQLPGIWTFDARYADGNEALCRVTVAPDGSYSSTITLPHRTNGSRVINMEGAFRVEDGFLIDTVTNDSQTNASMTFRSRILRANDHELILEDEKIPGVVYATNTIVFRKQTR
ncbi:MAG TPA: hypothetical protein VFM25_13880 [Verrucomicrobiae bacterium]|nr:hypothetical protein [Verrucomicrobiae bacterium]